ncbi:hypothetical protein CROQUDRAFT_444279 [Cronartium quercuum f. sp. fusiforme G11]|uniref:Zn(2)-C6 fungal-type domain-containing protein n=1 Tax=Cronartium quercuum f. sp. fusiforme G11 TaxID=708437 RepID=A0A9P6NKU1_9BASI|nr:hypothetical protein CROQUDRAFT_444279 [Cronartium quercuum f. sp. fusiforme G11]
MAGLSQSSSRSQPKSPKQPSTCTACRIRRVRCNREKPCSACVNRGMGEDCDVPEQLNPHYLTGPNVRPSLQSPLAPEINRINAMTSTLRSSGGFETCEPSRAVYARHQSIRSADPYLSNITPNLIHSTQAAYSSNQGYNEGLLRQFPDPVLPWPVSSGQLLPLTETRGTIGWLEQSQVQNSYPLDLGLGEVNPSPDHHITSQSSSRQFTTTTDQTLRPTGDWEETTCYINLCRH